MSVKNLYIGGGTSNIVGVAINTAGGTSYKLVGHWREGDRDYYKLVGHWRKGDGDY